MTSIPALKGQELLKSMAQKYEIEGAHYFKLLMEFTAVKAKATELLEVLMKKNEDLKKMKSEFDAECGKQKTTYEAMLKDRLKQISELTIPVPEPLSEIPTLRAIPELPATRAPPKRVTMFGDVVIDDKKKSPEKAKKMVTLPPHHDGLGLPNIVIAGTEFFKEHGTKIAIKAQGTMSSVTFSEVEENWGKFSTDEYRHLAWVMLVKVLIYDFAAIYESLPKIPGGPSKIEYVEAEIMRHYGKILPLGKLRYVAQDKSGRLVGSRPPYDLGQAIKIVLGRKDVREASVSQTTQPMYAVHS